jgi:hypothetical protein
LNKLSILKKPEFEAVKTGVIATTQLAVLIFAAALIALCSCTKGPHGLSADTYEGVRKTVLALRRANEYRDSGVLLFEPRLLEAERAADDIVAPAAHSAVTTASNTSAAVIARSCVKDLRLYREVQTLHLDYLERPPSRNAQQRALDEYKDQKLLSDVRQTVDGCIATLSGYL